MYTSHTIYDTGMADQSNGSVSLDYCHCGYLSADSDLFHDIVNIRLYADMQRAEIYIYVDIMSEGEKVH